MSVRWPAEDDAALPLQVTTANRGVSIGPLIDGFDSLGHGLAIWSADESLVFCNDAFRRRFQAAKRDLMPGIRLDAFLAALAQSGLLVLTHAEHSWVADELAAERACRCSEYTFRDGTVWQIERWALPAGGLVTMASDVTEVKREQRALQKARSDSETADRTKSRFLRAANHDLRQPLASLKILIYNCMSAEDEQHRAHLLHAMDVSVSIMDDLLGALLNIGQLDAGKVTPRITTFQLSTLLERLEVQFAHQAREKGLAFHLVPSKFAVISDRVLLERIVSNFVANAVRYTETGGIVVGCRRDGRGIRVEVRDSGCGIAPADQDAIFDEFFRVASDQIRHKHSLGLGLNIAKRLADILDHKIAVRSEPGRGSIFSIKLPLGDIWHSDIGEPEINERIGGEFMGLSALVLEDDETLLEALTELLERWGIVVSSLNAFGDIGAQFAGLQATPDFIITDYRLRGGVEGTKLVHQLRECIGAPVPAIVVTADTNPKLIKAIRADGFPVLIKPVSPPSLRVLMHNILFEPELVQELSNSGAR
jgi:signal transduction histidine kinase/CheY-like chemotaxis protein